jgi:hypothetical protein
MSPTSRNLESNLGDIWYKTSCELNVSSYHIILFLNSLSLKFSRLHILEVKKSRGIFNHCLNLNIPLLSPSDICCSKIIFQLLPPMCCNITLVWYTPWLVLKFFFFFYATTYQNVKFSFIIKESNAKVWYFNLCP